MQSSAECSAELRLTAVCWNDDCYWWVTEPAQTFGFIWSTSGNNTDLTCSTNTRICSLKIRCTF